MLMSWRPLLVRLNRHLRGAGVGAAAARDESGGSPAASSSSPTVVRLSPLEPEGIKRVQVGCGPHNLLAEWWNVDIRAFKGVDDVMDVTQDWPWSELDYIYGEHFLEHLSLEGACRFLLNGATALRSGGRIRLSTPSVEWVLRTHFTFDATGEQQRLKQTFAINRAFHGWGHHFLYSREFLVEALTAAGFHDITFHDYGQSQDPALCGLERHGGYRVVDGYPSVWIVEAVRGAECPAPSAEFLKLIQEQFGRYVDSGH